MLSIFYTRKEIATRISILYTGNILATAFAGLIAIGIFKLDEVAGLSGWQWLFIIQGVATFVVALAAAWTSCDRDCLVIGLLALVRLTVVMLLRRCGLLLWHDPDRGIRGAFAQSPWS